MSQLHNSQQSRGFTVVEALLILVIVAIVGVVGYKVYNAQSSTDKIAENTAAGSQQTATSETTVPASIDSASDLAQAEKALDQYGSSSSDDQDLSHLDSELSEF